MEKKTFIISFTEIELAILNKAIVELPFKEASPLVDSINKQITEQISKESK
jgi:hypothetical protein